MNPGGSAAFVTGTTQNRTHYSTAAYNAATGASLWMARYRAPTASGGEAVALSVAVSPDGSTVFLTGEMPGPKSNMPGGYGTVAYNAATGARLWTAQTSGPFTGGASSLAVSPDGFHRLRHRQPDNARIPAEDHPDDRGLRLPARGLTLPSYHRLLLGMGRSRQPRFSWQFFLWGQDQSEWQIEWQIVLARACLGLVRAGLCSCFRLVRAP